MGFCVKLAKNKVTRQMNIELYEYQRVAYDKVIKALSKFGRALMVMATGLGKTIVSAELVEFFLKTKKNSRVLFLCHDTGILEQSFIKYRELLGPEYTYARFFGEKKNWKPEKHTFVFATFQSNPHLFFKAKHFDYIIVDESHHAKAKTYNTVLSYFTPTWKLGMTATPDREDGEDIRLIFGHEVVNYTLAEGIGKGWLTYPDYKVLDDGLDNEIIQQLVQDVLVEERKITKAQLNELVFIRMRTEEQCKRILSYTDDGLKAIVFCNNINHLKHVLEMLPNSVAVHSDQSDLLNDAAKEMYINGLARHILVVDKFNEGIDLPDTDILAFLRPTNSQRIWLQQLGRGLRKLAGKEKVTILDFVGNVERLRDVYTLSIEIGKFDTTLNGFGEKLILDSPLHIEGSSFVFDFSEETVNLLSILDHAEKFDLYPTWQEASEATISLGIKSSPEYRNNYKSDARLPSDPVNYYNNFPKWKVFLGKVDGKLLDSLKDREELIQFTKNALSNYEITDYWTLRYESTESFKVIEFGVLGKIVNVYKIITGTQIKAITNERLDNLAKHLGWFPTKEEKIDYYKQELEKKGITDYLTLITFPTIKFASTTFGCFGKGKNFIRTILQKICSVNILAYEEIAKVLGWTLSEDEKKEEYKKYLAMHGITSRTTLLEIQVTILRYLDFGHFGKGATFFSLILKDKSPFTEQKVLALSDYLGWTEDLSANLVLCKNELAKHGIVDYVTLKQFSYTQLKTKTFGEIGDIHDLLRKKLGLNFRFLFEATYDLIADKLGWTLSLEQKKEIVIQELSKHGITDYWTLKTYSTTVFRQSSFGALGKGYRLYAFISNKTIPRITLETFEEISEILEWIPSEEEKVLRYKEELTKNGITTCAELTNIQIADFKAMDFGIFGKGRSFMSEVLNLKKSKITKKNLRDLAFKLKII